ncbi:hypothetical protein EDC04DRAFT_2887546 [Pisolithus marmoratus]|nr:hypothetical protein EDC04DRAFT_2887546 [Pisolithus marmoratus]
MSWTLLETLSTDILRAPSTPVTLPFAIHPLFVYILPPCLSYYAFAVLVILPGTPYRAAVLVDFSCKNSQRMYLSVNFALLMFCMVIRTLEWTSLKDPLKRRVRPTPSILIDALDLVTNLRGIDWNWCEGLRVSPDTRPTSRLRFAIYVLLSALYHSFICGTSHIAVQALASKEFPVLSGGTTFDDPLASLIHFARCSIVSILLAFDIYTGMQTVYDICSFIGVTVVQQDPAQWPPAFDEPWKATSLHEFWGYRWHQLARRTFIVLGGWPLGFVFGRVGYVLGSFLASGIIHNIAVAMLDQNAEWWSMLLWFGMMALGIIIEHVFKQVTGKRVGGWPGRVWTMAWLLMSGNMMVERFLRAGGFASGAAGPVKGIMEHYMTLTIGD